MQLIEDHYHANHRKLLKRLTYRAGTEWDAEEILHDAYERALRYIHAFNGEDFGAWFNTILNNALREHKNAAKGYATVEWEEDEEEGVPCSHYSDRVVEEIYEIINTKALVQIEILMLYFQQDYTARDISRITDHSYTNARKIISRFREELRELYG